MKKTTQTSFSASSCAATEVCPTGKAGKESPPDTLSPGVGRCQPEAAVAAPLFRKSKHSECKAGLLTRPPPRPHLPDRNTPSVVIAPFPPHAGDISRTYSSGNCCRFSRHSLFITTVYDGMANHCPTKIQISANDCLCIRKKRKILFPMDGRIARTAKAHTFPSGTHIVHYTYNYDIPQRDLFTYSVIPKNLYTMHSRKRDLLYMANSSKIPA